MTSFLGAIAKGAAYLYGGAADEDDEQQQEEQKNDNQSYQSHQSQQPYSLQSEHPSNVPIENAQKYTPKNVYCSAKGELWKFNPKKEEFKTLLNEVEALIIEHDTDQYLSSFHIIRKNGQSLFQQNISNELQIQYNKQNHSMVFAMYNDQKDRLEILSFIFANNSEEEEFKMAIAIKLYETNRKESFNDLIKKKDCIQEDQSYITQTYEIDPRNNNYINEDEDYQELDDDIIMLDINKTFDTKMRITSDNDNDDEEYDEYDEYDQYEEEEEKVNKWESAGNKPYDNDNDIEQHTTTSSVLSSPFKDDIRPSAFAHNKHITGSKAYNRTYVVREMKKGQSALGYFKHNDQNELQYEGKIIIKDIKNKSFTPSKVIQYKSDQNMLLLNDKTPTVSLLNLAKGKMVEEWDTKDLDIGGINDITSINKHSQLNDTQQIYGLNNNSMFMIDGRIPKKSKVVDSKSKTYKSKVDFNTISTSGNGFIAIGSSDGNIRLYNDVSKRAKTRLPGLGNKVKFIEISDDGLWILATCTDYIMVIPTKVPGTERTGFEGRGMGKLKPHPYILRLKYSDIQKYKLRKVDFTSAHFDIGKNIDEHWIVSSTGPYIIKWNFKKLKKSGIVNSYSIRRANSKVVHNEFRYGFGDDLLVTETNEVYAQHSSKKK